MGSKDPHLTAHFSKGMFSEHLFPFPSLNEFHRLTMQGKWRKVNVIQRSPLTFLSFFLLGDGKPFFTLSLGVMESIKQVKNLDGI